MVNITNIIPDVNENENRRLKYLFLVGTMENKYIKYNNAYNFSADGAFLEPIVNGFMRMYHSYFIS